MKTLSVSAIAWISVVWATAGQPFIYSDEPTFEQLALEKRVARDLAQARDFSERGDASGAAGIWQRAHQATIEFFASADPQQAQIWSTNHQRLSDVRSLLVAQGMALPEIGAMPPPPEMAAQTIAAPTDAPGNPMPAASETSMDDTFEKTVAPLFVQKCGRCHIDARRGQYSMATIADMTRDEVMIISGKPDDSYLFEMIKSGAMPKTRQKLSADEIAQVRDWIAAGAKFGGSDRAANLKSIAKTDVPAGPEAPEDDEAAAMSAAPKNGDVVSFAKHVAPILVDRCAVCHIDSQQVRGGLNLGTYSSMMRGGDNGELIRASKGEESLLVKKLRGTAGGQQMPAGGQPLSEVQIETISKWIDQGARFDGTNADSNLRDVVARAASANATHAELAAQRRDRAIANWNLIMDGRSPVVHESDNLIVLAPDDSKKPEQFAKLAEAVISKISSPLKVGGDDPLVKGKVTVYLFGTRYDYGEFGKMIERRDLPKESSLHWGNSQVDAYLVLQVAEPDYDALKPALAKTLAAVYAKGLTADTPDWFANGLGYSIAAKAYSGDDWIKLWLKRSDELTKGMARPDDFVSGRMSDDDAGLVAFQFIEYLKQSGGNKFSKLLNEMRDGTSFERAFAVTFEVTPAEMLSNK